MSRTEGAVKASSSSRPRSADPAVLEALYREHGPALRQLCSKRLGNERDADDACQEALLRAWSAIDRFDAARPVWPWLATIAGNVCIDIQRRARTAARKQPPCDLAPLSPEELALIGERSGLVREALAQLPSASRNVLFLRDVEGWSYSRIGRFEGRSAPAVRTAVTRARHQLRAQLEATARATGRWPLPVALLALQVRGRARLRRSRAQLSDVAMRSVAAVDGGTGLAPSLAGSAPGQVLLGALLAATVAVAPAVPTVPSRSPEAVPYVAADLSRSPAAPVLPAPEAMAPPLWLPGPVTSMVAPAAPSASASGVPAVAVPAGQLSGVAPVVEPALDVERWSVEAPAVVARVVDAAGEVVDPPLP
jgi:RNA polymerase sigma-70 factor (ECF subfamily)